MKTKYYRYGASNEAQEFIDSKFGSNEIEVEIDDSQVTLTSLEGLIELPYLIIDQPLVFEGHQFEELRDYRVEFTIGDKIFTTKSLMRAQTKQQIAERAVTAWVTASTRVSKAPISNLQREKIKEERELLKALKAQKPPTVEEKPVKIKKKA